MILLDTCALIWLATGAPELSESARAVIQQHAGTLLVSAISAFEIGLLKRKGRLAFRLTASAWFAEAVRHHGLREIPISGAIAAASTELPPIHRDPADRLIVATAQALDVAVLTPDVRIRSYPGTRTAW